MAGALPRNRRSVSSGGMGDLTAATNRRRPGPAADHAHVAHARGRDERRQGHPHPVERRRAALLRRDGVLRGPRARPEGRAHVALRGGHQRGDRRGDPRRGLQGRDARRSTSPSACATARRACARRSRSRRAIPSTSRRRCRARRRRRSTRCSGSAVASARGTRRLIGVEAHGMTACPCAQELVTARSRERLAADGFSEDEIERVLRRRAGGHPQPARHRPPARGLPRGLRHAHRGRARCCGSWRAR